MAINSMKVRVALTLKPTTAPSAPENGDLYYDIGSNTFQFYQNGNFLSYLPSTGNATANISVNNLIEGLTTTATAAGTTTLTVSSTHSQQFTGSTTQTVVLPDATTLTVGQSFFIMNRSSGVVTVNANGGGLIQTMVAGSQTLVTVTSISTSAGSWDSAYSVTSSGTTNPTTNGTRASPNNIVAGTGLSSSFVSTSALVQVVFVQGSGGAVTITASPAIVAGTIVGQQLYIVGRSATNTLTIPNQSAAVEINGNCTLGAGDILQVMWDGVAWAEIARNN